MKRDELKLVSIELEIICRPGMQGEIRGDVTKEERRKGGEEEGASGGGFTHFCCSIMTTGNPTQVSEADDVGRKRRNPI